MISGMATAAILEKCMSERDSDGNPTCPYTESTIQHYMREVRAGWRVRASHTEDERAEQLARLDALWANGYTRLMRIPMDTEDPRHHGNARGIIGRLLNVEALRARILGTYDLNIKIDHEVYVEQQRDRLLQAMNDPVSKRLAEELYARTHLLTDEVIDVDIED